VGGRLGQKIKSYHRITAAHGGHLHYQYRVVTTARYVTVNSTVSSIIEYRSMSRTVDAHCY